MFLCFVIFGNESRGCWLYASKCIYLGNYCISYIIYCVVYLYRPPISHSWKSVTSITLAMSFMISPGCQTQSSSSNTTLGRSSTMCSISWSLSCSNSTSTCSISCSNLCSFSRRNSCSVSCSIKYYTAYSIY